MKTRTFLRKNDELILHMDGGPSRQEPYPIIHFT